MCGFVGELRFDGGEPSMAALERMAAVVAVRGPDATGRRVVGPLAVAHHRLRIFDLDPRADQPMVDDARGLTLVYNGALYDHDALADELRARGHRLRTTSDTEVILAGYAAWGEAVVDRLDGQFAFALHDAVAGRLLLARDPLGIKPLYLAAVPGAVRFGSTLPALLAGGDVDTSIDAVALHHYLSLHGIVPAPRTILRGVEKVEPGTCLRIDADGGRHWRRFGGVPPPAPAQTDDVDLLTALRTAVRRRLAGDRPVGVLLSGGLDSSLLVALAREAGPVSTFSIGFAGDETLAGDEFEYSDAIARAFGTRHERWFVDPHAVEEALPSAIGAMSEPMTSHDAVGFWWLGRGVAGSHRVVLTGQGADEVFGGYHWYARLADAPVTTTLSAYREAFFDRSHARISAWLAPAWRGADHTGDWLQSVGRPVADAPAAAAAMWLDTSQMLAGDPLPRVDNMLMASAVEARVPFLDRDVLRVAARISVADKLARGGKGVLKTIAGAILPPEVVRRPKGYFPVPAVVREHGRIRRWVDEVLDSPRSRQRGLWSEDARARMLADADADVSPLGGRARWQVASLELWLSARGL